MFCFTFFSHPKLRKVLPVQFVKNCVFYEDITVKSLFITICTYMSKDAAIFVATGKILNYTHADMSLRVAVLSFSILTFSFKCWVLLSLSKSSPFWFPTAQISFSSPFPFWNLQSLDSIDLLISKKFIGYRVCHNTKASFVSIEWVIWYSVECDNIQHRTFTVYDEMWN